MDGSEALAIIPIVLIYVGLVGLLVYGFLSILRSLRRMAAAQERIAGLLDGMSRRDNAENRKP